MFYKKFLNIIVFLLISNCSTSNLTNNNSKDFIKENFSNRGFALVYNESLFNEKVISKKINERSLSILQKNLKKGTQVKITNILNNKSLIANVETKGIYPLFNNSVVSQRIAEELELDVKEPYIEIIAIKNNSLFVAKKAKTFNEEKSVANKVPVNDISINDLNEDKVKKKKKLSNKFSYSIKIADFYFNKTALLLTKRIKNETKIKKPKIQKITEQKYRVYLGPFDNINSLQKSFNDINILEFENIEFIKND
ncbi:hypothetical protein N9K55_03085 [Candidatus Pelagibacter bacterium]|nr:hypothetical protein [Candidatus Pelagibacter bacterium]